MEYKPLVLVSGKAEELWNRMKLYPQVFDDIIPRTLEAFNQTLLNPTNQFYEIVEGEELIGLAAATHVRPKLDANMHLVMFDRRLRGREPIILDALRDFAIRAKLRRMTVLLPGDNKTAIKLVGRLGFKPEGVMRKAHLRDGIYRDYHVFGILLEELFHIDSDGEGLRDPGPDGGDICGPVRGGDNEIQPDGVRTDDEEVRNGGHWDSTVRP